MEFCGEIVKHKAFGRGRIIEFVNNYVTVLFDESKEQKKFTYPSAFGAFLELENKYLLQQIVEDKNIIAQNEADENERINEERSKLTQIMNSKKNRTSYSKNSNLKTSDKNNIAFKCNYCDGGRSKESVGYKGVCSDETIKYNINKAKHIWCSDSESSCCKYLNGEITYEELCALCEEDGFVCYESQMLRFWRAYAGITQTGENKGKPMTLRNVKANSLAFLTTRLPNADDEDRFIFAVFLIDDSYEGDNKDEGYVEANTKYRIELSPNEAKNLKFWDYYFNSNKPETIKFGSGLHRYFTDVQAAQVLKKICEIKKGTLLEEISEQLMEYYCKIKKLDIENIPVPNGALQR